MDRTNREAKRCVNLALSPVLTTMSETVEARAMIQAMRFEAFFAERMAADVDAWNRFHYFSVSAVNLAVLLTIYVRAEGRFDAGELLLILSLFPLQAVYSPNSRGPRPFRSTKTRCWACPYRALPPRSAS